MSQLIIALGVDLANLSSTVRDSWEASIENCVKNRNLSSGDGLQTITGDDLCRQHDPQTLSQAFNFYGRVIKFQSEGKTSMNRAVQQTLIEFTKPSLHNGGKREYKFLHPALSDTEKERTYSNNGESSQNPGSNLVATCGCGG